MIWRGIRTVRWLMIRVNVMNVKSDKELVVERIGCCVEVLSWMKGGRIGNHVSRCREPSTACKIPPVDNRIFHHSATIIVQDQFPLGLLQGRCAIKKHRHRPH